MIHVLGRLPLEDFYVCVSGGIDSMTLLTFLVLGKRKNFTALYFNHGTTHGNDAQIFVTEECRRLGVDLVCGEIDKSCFDRKKSMEENWRYARYEFIGKFSSKPILMAHHLDDAVESYIMSVLRGHADTIPYKNDKYNVIRPFLVTTRRDISSWGERHGVNHIEDPSNKDVSYDRNFVRHELLEKVRRINPGIQKTVKKIILDRYNRSFKT